LARGANNDLALFGGCIVEITGCAVHLVVVALLGCEVIRLALVAYGNASV